MLLNEALCLQGYIMLFMSCIEVEVFFRVTNMKKLNRLLLFIIGFVSFSLKAEMTFSFQANKYVGLLNFMEAISAPGHRPPAFRDIFEKSKFNTEKTQQLIGDFKIFYRENKGNFDFKKGAESRVNGFDVHKYVHIQAALSQNLKDLKGRTLGIFPFEDHGKIFDILEKFEPIYDALFWNTMGSEITEKAKKFEKYAKEKEVSKFLGDVETFYKGKWPESIPFMINLHPLSRIPVPSLAEHIGPLLSFASIIEGQDLVSMGGVLVHEVTHAIFSSQEESVQKNLERAYTTHSSSYKHLAYKYLDEGVATAIGNGIFVRKISGIYQKNLYSDKYINGYAHALIPLVEGYLKNKKPWDQDFVDASIQKFSETFPDSYKNIEALMNEISLYVEGGFNLLNIQDRFFSQYNINSLYSSNEIPTQLNAKIPLVHVFIVRDTSDLTKLLKFTKSEEEIIKSLPSLGVVTGFDKEKRAFVIGKISTEKDMEKVMGALQQKSLINGNFQRIL
jgi:hypothetical protein